MGTTKQKLMPAKFIVFEGIDGSGLTTHTHRLQEWLHKTTGQRVHVTKEPSGGPLGALIRLRLAGRLEVDETTAALMFAGDRMDHLYCDIEPRLAKGEHVLCDRYVLSSLAYQSLALDSAWIEAINRQARRPDLTIYIDVPVAICLSRIAQERWSAELYETEATLSRVQQNYRRFIAELRSKGERVAVIAGARDNQPRSLLDVATDIQSAVQQILQDDHSSVGLAT